LRYTGNEEGETRQAPESSPVPAIHISSSISLDGKSTVDCEIEFFIIQKIPKYIRYFDSF
jgi:hypothetical protein